MNAITLRHHTVTLAYCTSPFNSKRHTLGRQIRLFLHRRRIRQHMRSLSIDQRHHKTP